MHEGSTITPPRAQIFIKRPRLTKLLDDSGARIILLLAPAGYGKTTLAREWTDEQEHVGWYTGAPAMIDVAGLSVGIAEVLGSMGGERGADMVERVRILAARGHDARGLAKAVSGGAPGADSIVVVDDYHHALGSEDAEAFLEELVSLTEFRLLLTSRDRPGWLPARKVVYGEAAVVEMDALAFTDEEALAVLGDSGMGIVAEARGWPAVIGLAAMRGDAALAASGLQGDDLYEFFAEDLFQSASPKLQDAMFLLALAGVDGARALLGPGYVELVAAAAERGFLAGADRQSVHPLLRGFLLAKLRERDDAKRDSIVASAVEYLAGQHRWDDCLFVLEHFPDDELVLSTLECGLAEILDSGRIATLTLWLDLASGIRLEHPLLLLAEAELALRARENNRARVLGERAGDILEGALASRGYLVAAFASHLGDSIAETGRLASLALTSAESDEQRAHVLWLDFSDKLERSIAAASERLEQLRHFSNMGASHSLRLRTAAGLVLCQSGDVRGAIPQFEVAAALLTQVGDPFARTNLLHFLSYAYLLSARYEDALAQADRLSEESRQSGLQFADDYAVIRRAAALIGIRRIGQAQATIDALLRKPEPPSLFISSNIALQRVRIALSSGDLERAAHLASAAIQGTDRPAFRGEVFGYRAICAAATDDFDRASHAVIASATESGFVEAAALQSMARAIIALRRDGDREQSIRLVTQAVVNGSRDAFVMAYRACPALAQAMLASDFEQEMIQLLARSRDASIARSVGLRIPREFQPRQRLSRREHEVYDLLVQGRTNREIAKTLFISESTTKVHVRHIFEKLAVRSRAEAARLAAVEDDL